MSVWTSTRDGRYWCKQYTHCRHVDVCACVYMCLSPRIKIDIKRLFRQRYRYDLTNKRVVQQFPPHSNTHRRAFTCNDDIVSAISAGWPKWASDYRNLASWPHNRADPNWKRVYRSREKGERGRRYSGKTTPRCNILGEKERERKGSWGEERMREEKREESASLVSFASHERFVIAVPIIDLIAPVRNARYPCGINKRITQETRGEWPPILSSGIYIRAGR